MGVGNSKGTSEVKVVNVALANSGTSDAQRTSCTGFRIAGYRVNLSNWVVVHTCILLEIDASCHSTAFCIRTVTSSEEYSWGEQGTATAPDELTVLIIEHSQAYEGMFEIFHKIPRDRIDRADCNCQDRDYGKYSQKQLITHVIFSSEF